MQDGTQSRRGADVIYATAPNGLSLPVIDVSNPAFAVADDPASLRTAHDGFATWIRRQHRIPQFPMRMMLRHAARRSALLRAVFQTDRDFLDSITTYMFKLGPDHLPPGFDSPVDKRVAASPNTVMVRLRMQQVAKLLAHPLPAPLAANPGGPLHLVNIAGGPALDSMNALILLNRERPDLLRRHVVIDVLDAHGEGPAFGANALAALTRAGAPLQGLSAQFRHRPYDWSETAPLAALLAELKAARAVVAASSEGGLFEYGSDAAIVANLAALAAGGVPFVAGSVTSASEMRKRMIAQTRFKLHPRGSEGLAPLAAQAGYTLVTSKSSVVSDQVLLRRTAD